MRVFILCSGRHHLQRTGSSVYIVYSCRNIPIHHLSISGKVENQGWDSKSWSTVFCRIWLVYNDIAWDPSLYFQRKYSTFYWCHFWIYLRIYNDGFFHPYRYWGIAKINSVLAQFNPLGWWYWNYFLGNYHIAFIRCRRLPYIFIGVVSPGKNPSTY